MIHEPDTMGAAAWLVACVAATVLLLVIWGLASLLHPSVWLWLLSAPPEMWLALLMLGVISVWWPR